MAHTRARVYPPTSEMGVSHEPIYNGIYAMPARWSASQRIARPRPCATPVTNDCRAAEEKTAGARSPICSASTRARPKSKIVSSLGTGHWEAISSRENPRPSERHFGRAHQPAGDAVQTGGPNNVALIVHPLSWRVQVTCMFTIDATLPRRG